MSREMRRDRLWMYRRYRPDGRPNPKFRAGLQTFIEFVQSQPEYTGKIKCPCMMCDNMSYRDEETVRYHVSNCGFVPCYDTWRFHGETETPEPLPLPLVQRVPLVDQDSNMDNTASVADSTTTSQFNSEARDQRLLKLEQQLQEEREERQRLQDLVQTQQKALQELLSQSKSASEQAPSPPS